MFNVTEQFELLHTVKIKWEILIRSNLIHR